MNHESQTIEYRPLSELTLIEAASALARGFENYVVPATFDATRVATMIQQEAIDEVASLVALIDGVPAAIGLVARRGWTSRLAAMGVAAEARGRRLGAALLGRLLDDARARGERRMVLEVIEQNAPAVALYRKAGFEVVERLVGFVGEAGSYAPDAALEEVDPAEVGRIMARHGARDLPWQASAETMSNAAPPWRAYRLGPAYATITDPAGASIALRAIVVEEHARGRGAARRLVDALRGAHPDKAWRVVAIVPEERFAGFFERAGFARDTISQFHMARDI
jgi:ribosomal protein S18 acetylase RimI-like enzyme